MIKVGYLGPQGTFSEEAAEKVFEDKKYKKQDFGTIAEILVAVADGTIDDAVVPVESSLEGAVTATLDVLAGELDLKIKGEAVLQIIENLLVKKGTKLSEITAVYSHPQAIGQCRSFLSKELSKAEIRHTNSTASAAREVLESTGKYAAIASFAAAKAYDLEVIAQGIQDNGGNVTRFLDISKNYNVKTGDDKTSIVFSTEDKPGSLYGILDIFSLWDINMTRIESRPAKSQLGRYIFFVDIQGHIDDENVRDALTMVKRKTSYYKFLGSYPRCK